ncbi:uncharacterized protein LOC121046847 [Ixodes scapularis]|uniref:uncharacterized protein LOC121046847 n=1 Tax=Ixodes scapularis TaxID=6945 RepID=UPI001C390F8E|nr:uncharacterized protein LOC121046847 [Ixodes scapularis]
MSGFYECLRLGKGGRSGMFAMLNNVPPPVEILQSDFPWYQRFCGCSRQLESGGLLNEALTKTSISTLDRIKTIKYIERYPSVVGDAKNLVTCLENLQCLVKDEGPDIVVASTEALTSVLRKHGSKLSDVMVEKVLKTSFELLLSARVKIRNRFVDVLVLLLKLHPGNASSNLLYLAQSCDQLQTVCAIEAFCRIIQTRYLKFLPLKCIFHYFSINVDNDDANVRSYASKGVALMDFYF